MRKICTNTGAANLIKTFNKKSETWIKLRRPRLKFEDTIKMDLSDRVKGIFD
jgi:hypothetical protein